MGSKIIKCKYITERERERERATYQGSLISLSHTVVEYTPISKIVVHEQIKPYHTIPTNHTWENVNVVPVT